MRAFTRKPEATQQAKSVKSTKPGWTPSQYNDNMHSILQLQRTIGNQAVKRLLQANAEGRQMGGDTATSPGSIYDFSRILAHASGLPKYERSNQSLSLTSQQVPQGHLMRQARGPTRVRIPQPQAPGGRDPSLNTFRWPQFINRGDSVCAPGVVLGTNPGGQFLNAMELVFTEQNEAGELRRRLSRGGFSRYRIRQTIEEQVWQFVRGRWFLLSRTPAGTPDDPDPALQCWNPPEMRTVDTPGFSAWQGIGPNTRQFGVSGGRSDSDATIFWVQQNFYTWVEGERAFVGGWQTVSVSYPWHSSLRLERSSPHDTWHPASTTRIQGGHMEFGASPLTETR